MNTSDLCPRRLLVSILLCIIFAGIGVSAIVDATWIGPASGSWNLAANWSTGAVPNNGANTYNVFIDDETVQVNGSFTVDTANITSGIINIGSTSAQSLDLVLGTSTIGGKIRLIDTDGYGYGAYLYINAPITLAGTGSVDFASGGENYISGAGSLTVGENFTIQSLAGSSGSVNTILINNGTIQANGGTINLNENIANNNIIRSLSGTVNLNTMIVNNLAGSLSVQSGQSFNIASSTIEGGVLTGSGTFNVNGNSAFDGSGGITLDAGSTVQFGSTAAENLTVKNGITNNGLVKLADVSGYGYQAKLLLQGTDADRDVAFDGSGQIIFASGGENYIDNSSSDPDARLKITSGQTLTTLSGADGQVYSEAMNNGLISANGGTITLYENIVNNNILSSVSTGIMNLDALTVDNAAGQLSVVSGSSFNIISTTVAGGLLTGGGTFNVNGNSAFDGSGGITLDAGSTVQFGSTAAENLTVKNGITNNGLIKLTDVSGYGYQAKLLLQGTDADRDVAFDGSGQIVFASGGENYIDNSSSDPDARLKITSGQTLTTLSGADGQVYSEALNNGLISANGGTITLYENIVNNNILSSVSTGIMNLDALTVDNAAGQLSVASGSSFNIISTTVAGGLLTGGGTFNVNGNSAFDGSGGITLDAGSTVQFGSTAAENLTVKNGITNNGLIKLTDVSGYSYQAKLLLQGTDADRDVAFDGSGQIVFASGGENYIDNSSSDPDARLKITSGQTLTTLSGADGQVYSEALNNGLISANGGTITLYENITNNNQLAATSGTINLETLIVQNSSGTMSANSAGVFNINSSTIAGGLLTGGTVNINGSSTFDGSSSPVSLFASTVNVGTTGQENLFLKGTINNDSTIKILDAAGYGYTADIICNGTVNLNGSGQIWFASGGENYIKAAGTGGSLIIGANQTVKTSSGYDGIIQVGTINNGTIASDGGTLTLPTSLTNNGLVRSSSLSTLTVSNNVAGTGSWRADNGTIKIQNGANVSTAGDITIINNGKLQVINSAIAGSDLIMDSTGIIDISSSVSISDDVAFAMTDEAKWKWSASSSLQMTGGAGTGVGSWGGWGSLEIGGYDYGTNPANHIGAAAGFTNNFSLPQLVIGADAHIYLADLMDNGNRNGSFGFNEALYVNTLTFADGAGLLNLNGLHLYYNTLVGNSEQIIDIAVPEPATITILLIGSLAFTRKKK